MRISYVTIRLLLNTILRQAQRHTPSGKDPDPEDPVLMRHPIGILRHRSIEHKNSNIENRNNIK